jgi:integrase
MLGVVRRHFIDYFKDKRLSQITEIVLQDFLVFLKTKKGLSAASVNQARNAAFVALRYAKRRKLIKGFDFDAVIRASGKAKLRGILSREEAEKLFSVTWRDNRSRLINLIASRTGMRIGEIRALRVCDIQKDRISVAHSWSSGDGGLKCTKTGESRDVPLLPDLYEEIHFYIRTYQPLFKLDSFIFPGRELHIPYDARQIQKDFQS